MNRLIFVLPMLLFAAVVTAFAVGLRNDPSEIPSVFIDRPLPAFDLPGLTAGTPGFASTDFKGEPKLLNIFASWCISCRVEHPFLMALKDKGVPVYGLDWKDKPADGAGWLAKFGDPYKITANDENGRAGIDLGVTGAPETFVVDKRGRVRYKHIGPVTPQAWDEIIEPLMTKLKAEA